MQGLLSERYWAHISSWPPMFSLRDQSLLLFLPRAPSCLLLRIVKSVSDRYLCGPLARALLGLGCKTMSQCKGMGAARNAQLARACVVLLQKGLSNLQGIEVPSVVSILCVLVGTV